ncbi:Probable inactive leucine-rich repeat receptor-like protein kinase At1g66830 [Linum grandiflorum]
MESVSAAFLTFCFILFFIQAESENPELKSLMEFKSALDPGSKFLATWTVDGDPCGGAFEGVGCNEHGQVANISLQGKGLKGKISPAVGSLKNLTGLYLHYNSLYGEVPAEVGNLTELVDLYLNVNNLSGQIPPEIGNLGKLQVLQLCYNQFTGSVPVQLGTLKKLTVLALQSNRFTGAIPANLGNLGMLMRLDLSFNHFFGSIPTKLADAPVLESLDIRNNTFSGNVPLALKRLNEGFQFANNPGLCGSGFMDLRACNSSEGTNPNRPEAYGQGGQPTTTTREIPETADLTLPSARRHHHEASLFIIGSVFVTLTLLAVSALSYTQYRRRKQKLSDSANVDPTPDHQQQPSSSSVYRKNGSPLISLEYPNGWDPLADHGRRNNAVTNGTAGSPQDALFHSFKFNLEEIETATQYFSESNVLGGKKFKFSATYKGILRDGSSVAVKCISKSSCKSDEAEFLRGLNVLTLLSHENLVRFRGFCCSRGRGECFVVYDFVPNGNLMRHLDVVAAEDDAGGDSSLVLEWSTRVSIVKGIAKGIAYLHSYKPNKPSIIHQNITAEKILIDKRYNPMVSGSGLQSLLTNDAVFSALKASAAMGYMAPEYSTTGKFTDKSDVYAFGVVVFQVLSGKRKVSNLVRLGAEACRFDDYLDANLKGRFFEYEAAKLARIAWLCTHESPVERPSMEAVVQELGNCSSCI